MPDDQVKSDHKRKDQLQTDGGAITGRTVSGPVRTADVWHQTLTGANITPAIYDLSQVDRSCLRQGVLKASLLGFNTILLSEFESDIVDAANACNLRVLLAIDISVTDDQNLISNHPDWFVKSLTGTKFIYLSEVDAAISWWTSKFQNWIECGIGGFICWNAAHIPSSIWHHIISKTNHKNANIQFYASVFGALPDQVHNLHDCGFSYSVSSSCWWDFSAGWLGDETNRLNKLAPPVALTIAPGSLFPDSEHLRRRSLTFAAIFGAGWLMPAGFESDENYDLSNYVTYLNQIRLISEPLQLSHSARLVSSPGSVVALLNRGQKLLLAINSSDVEAAKVKLAGYAAYLSDTGVNWIATDDADPMNDQYSISLPPSGFCIFKTENEKSISTNQKIIPDCEAPRIAIESITPKVDEGHFPVRRIIGETLVVEADIISDGHDKLAAEVIFRPINETKWQSRPMQPLGNDRWQGTFTLSRLGRYVYAIKTWRDKYATLVDEITKKHNASVDTHLEIMEALELIRQASANNSTETGNSLKKLLGKLNSASYDDTHSELLSDQVIKWMQKIDLKEFVSESALVTVDAERLSARFANWYEVFPRSQSGDPMRHGNFQDVIIQLPRIAEMGFDVLYFPPIHPIGHKNRKGRNNTLTPSHTDPGSPYAIGNENGGHDAIHPELGTLEDFHHLRDAAERHGIELALDFAVQCAPDHPWLQQHKEWFDWRSDGSIRYAENPPKKYEDIVNVEFYNNGSKPSLWLELRDVVQFWVDQGVKIFRVDNPHTKPLPFWQWLIADIRGRHPEVIFLAEAFTKPKIMYRLAKIGFSQSYTYFTWRNTKAELKEYLTELNTSPVNEFFRPHFFVNTPDINPVFLQKSGRPGFLIRAALAATLSGLWGVYNGFELCEASAVPGKEEYSDSEKYQIRVWNHDAPGNIVPEITRLNTIRRNNSALHSHLGLKFHSAYDEEVILFSKIGHDGNVVLVAINLDPFDTHETTIEIPLYMFGEPDDGNLLAEDLMRDHQFIWRGKYQPVTLHPEQPFCIWRIQTLRK